MPRYMLFATAVGLMLVGVGIRADERENTGGAQQPTPSLGAPQSPQAPDAPGAPQRPDQDQPVTAPERPAPDTPAVPNPPEQPPQEPVAPQPEQPQPAPPQPEQPQPAPPVQEPQQPVQPDQAPPEAQPVPAPEIDTQGMAVQLTPLQEFISHQNHEIGMLSRQMDAFKAANRKDAVMALYHMIRDHTLVSDAAQNVLARRGELSRPFPVRAAEPMAQSPDEIVDQQIRAHEQHIAQVQQMLANAATPEERSIYERDLALANKHLGWMRGLDQGRQLQIGFFGPTVPLARIAGYREESTVGQPARSSRPARRMRSGQARRSGSARRSGYRGRHH